MKKLLFMILASFVVLSVSCDDKDDTKPTSDEPVVEKCFCDSAKTVECQDADASKCDAPEPCKCDDGSDCPDGDKVKCDVPVTTICDPTCNDDETCVCKEEGDKSVCGCVNNTEPDPCKCDDGSDCPEGNSDNCAKPEPACDPECTEGHTCECVAENDSTVCACKPVPEQEEG